MTPHKGFAERLEPTVGSHEQPMLPSVSKAFDEESYQPPADPNASLARALLDLSTRLSQLEKHVLSLSSQQAMAEMAMERNARATALDLAIKYVRGPDSAMIDPSGTSVTELADGFLVYLKAGAQG